jgi:hypothetical protein
MVVQYQSIIVMPGLVPGIYVGHPSHRKPWMAGSSPAMTPKTSVCIPL